MSTRKRGGVDSMINNNGNGNGLGGNGHKSSGDDQPPRAGLNTGTATVGNNSQAPGVRTSRLEEADFDDEILLDDDAEVSLGEGDEQATHDLKREEKRGGRLRRALVGLAAMCAFGLIMFLVAYFWLFNNSNKNEMSLQVRTSPESNKTGVAEPPAGELTAEEIARALNNPNKPAPSVSETTIPQVGILPNGGTPITDRPPVDAYSTTVDQSLSQQQQVGTDAARQTGQTTSSDATRNVSASSATRAGSSSGANTERSIRVNQIINERASAGSSRDSDNINRNGASGGSESRDSEVTENRTVALPPLGTMLPVRTLGTVYTLRTESLVRMQLTRDVGGQGWSIARGTELYGTVRGADYEIGRAYVALIGFIDPQTNKMVRLQGNVLGGDGTDGLRGRKHKIGGGWSRALRQAGAVAVDALGVVAGTIGRRPVVVGDVYGYGGARATGALTAELNGIAGNGNNRSGFVEVTAGSTGYVLVMQMPRDAQGADALTSLPSSELERLADPTLSRAGTQLSDEQLAVLITTGTPEQIRAVLPRMTLEMRRVAQGVLASMEQER